MSSLLKSYQTNKPFLICSHRGVSGGNVIQNTIESAIIAYKLGTDIVECDICRSKDGQYYLFHDGHELVLFGKEFKFEDMVSTDLEKIPFRNAVEKDSNKYLITLEKFLAWLPRDRLVNIDRSWKYWQDNRFFEILENSKKIDNIILKSPVKKEYLESISQTNFYYFPIVYTQEEFRYVIQFNGINLVGLELIAKDICCDLLTKEFTQEISRYPVVLVNSEIISTEKDLFLGLDDDMALFSSAEESWGKILDFGINVIQTDWPFFLNHYRKSLM